jgi:hypothetical protein
MKLAEHVTRVAEFNDLGDADKIRFFAWFIHDERGDATFTTSDIGTCFDSLHVKRPPNISASLAKMLDRGELLGNPRAYRLEKAARDRLSEKYGRRAASVHVDRLLVDLPARISNSHERAYLDEALICFRHGAFRSAIVMTWNLAFSHVCEVILTGDLAGFNRALNARYPKATPVAKRDDFADTKEHDVVEFCRVANILSKNMVDILREKLTKRNAAAHPSGVVVTQLAAESFISELVENVVLRI